MATTGPKGTANTNQSGEEQNKSGVEVEAPKKTKQTLSEAIAAGINAKSEEEGRQLAAAIADSTDVDKETVATLAGLMEKATKAKLAVSAITTPKTEENTGDARKEVLQQFISLVRSKIEICASGEFNKANNYAELKGVFMSVLTGLRHDLEEAGVKVPRKSFKKLEDKAKEMAEELDSFICDVAFKVRTSTDEASKVNKETLGGIFSNKSSMKIERSGWFGW